MPYVVGDECILCGACVAGCPNGAVTEGQTKAVIDPNLCVECGTCAANCPSGAITFVEEVEEDNAEARAGDAAVRDAHCASMDDSG